MSGSSKDFFDFNHDGKIDAFEGAAKLEFYDEISKDHSSDHGDYYGGRRWKSTRAGAKLKKNTAAPRKTPNTAQKAAETETDANIKLIFKILLVIACLFAAFRVYSKVKITYDREKALESVEKRMDEYKSKVTEELPGFCEERGIGLSGTYTAQADSNLEYSPGSGSKYQFYSVHPDYSVTLKVDETFDRLADREKYDYLTALYPMAAEAHSAFLEEYFPEYAAGISQEPAEELHIAYKKAEYEVFIETPQHSYQYSRMYDDLFILDGESYFLEDEQSRWNK